MTQHWTLADRAQASGPRARRGALAYHAGHAAEDQIVRHYQAAGYEILERRWRGMAGEVDLIVRDGDQTVFVEVKKAATHAEAAGRLNRRQMDRLCQAACEYLGLEGEMRFDAALVDAQGRVEVLEAAFGGW